MSILDLESISKAQQAQGLGEEPINPVGYHTHNGIDSPELDISGVAGNDQEVQYNNNGEQAGDPNFKWDDSSQTLTFAEGVTIETEDGNGFFLYGSDASELGNQGSAVEINGGDGYPGGSIDITAGNGTRYPEDLFDSGDGGDVNISAGSVSDHGSAGAVYISGGSAGVNNSNKGNASPGEVIIEAGSVFGSGYGAGVEINAGNSQGANYDGGDIGLNLSNGNSGENIGRLRIDQGVEFNLFNANTETSTATPKIIQNSKISLDPFKSIFIEATILARRTGGSGGAAGDSASYIRRATYKRISTGAPALVGSIQDDYTVEDQAGWDVTFVLDGNDIYLQVTGATNNTIIWDAHFKYMVNSDTASSLPFRRFINEINMGGEDISIEENVTINII